MGFSEPIGRDITATARFTIGIALASAIKHSVYAVKTPSQRLSTATGAWKLRSVAVPFGRRPPGPLFAQLIADAYGMRIVNIDI